MTAFATLRARLASRLHLRLRHAGLSVTSTVADDMALQALRDAHAEQLLAHAAAADSAAAGFEVVADGGVAPADLETRRTAWTAARDGLATDPAYTGTLAERAPE